MGDSVVELTDEAGSTKDKSAERAAANESTFREANEDLAKSRARLGLDGRTPFLCECQEETCTTLLSLTEDEYRQVRAKPNRFVLAPGHPYTLGVPVLSNSRYVLVEKHGKAREVAEREAD